MRVEPLLFRNHFAVDGLTLRFHYLNDTKMINLSLFKQIEISNLEELQKSAALKSTQQVVTIVETKNGAKRCISVSIALTHKCQVELNQNFLCFKTKLLSLPFSQ